MLRITSSIFKWKTDIYRLATAFKSREGVEIKSHNLAFISLLSVHFSRALFIARSSHLTSVITHRRVSRYLSDLQVSHHFRWRDYWKQLKRPYWGRPGWGDAPCLSAAAADAVGSRCLIIVGDDYRGLFTH